MSMYPSTPRIVASLMTVALGALQPGCANEDFDANDPVEASASALQVSHFQHVFYGPIDIVEPEQAASATATGSGPGWPAGCSTATQDPTNRAVVHVHLQDCTGPFGLRRHTGDITILYSKNPDGTLHAQATSSNMTVNDHPVQWSGAAEIKIENGLRDVDYTGAWTRVNGRGETVSHSSTLNILIDPKAGCRTVNGAGTTNVANREIDSVLKDVKVCRKTDGEDGCPTGTITHTRASNGNTVTIQFDGTAEADVTGPKGRTKEVPLVCTP